jgi:chaperonin cofactor prefoldin
MDYKEQNRQLRREVNRLKKAIKVLESDRRTLQRAFDKSTEHIRDKLQDKSLEEILEENK